MVTASDFADWWDKQNKETHEILGQFVEDHPNIFSVGLAVVVTTVTDFAAGTVDVLRLGKGASQGGFGYASDALRFLSVLGPLGKSLRMIGGGVTRRLGFLMKDPNASAGICTWVAAAKALRHSGTGTMFAKVDDLTRLMGKPMSQLGGIWADDLVSAIRAMGAKVHNVGIPKSIDDVFRVAKSKLSHNSAMLFSVEWKLAGASQNAQHTLYIFKDGFGRLKLADRVGKVAKSLADFEKFVPNWAGIANANVFTSGGKGAMLMIEGPKMLYIDKAMKLAALALPMNVATALNLDEIDSLEALDAEWLDYLQSKRPKNTWKVSTIKIPRVDYLWGVRFRLKELGFYKGKIRGKYDTASRNAVIEFQKAQEGLRADGIPGPKTQAKLVEVCGY